MSLALLLLCTCRKKSTRSASVSKMTKSLRARFPTAAYPTNAKNSASDAVHVTANASMAGRCPKETRAAEVSATAMPRAVQPRRARARVSGHSAM